MEAQAQGTQCGTGWKPGLGCRRHLLQGPQVSALTWLCQAGWSVTLGIPVALPHEEPAQEEEQPILGPTESPTSSV